MNPDGRAADHALRPPVLVAAQGARALRLLRASVLVAVARDGAPCC
ncbi:hypothetical protein ACGF12_36730 [Kitasatospora sp. NPDC048296]